MPYPFTSLTCFFLRELPWRWLNFVFVLHNGCISIPSNNSWVVHKIGTIKSFLDFLAILRFESSHFRLGRKVKLSGCIFHMLFIQRL